MSWHTEGHQSGLRWHSGKAWHGIAFAMHAYRTAAHSIFMQLHCMRELAPPGVRGPWQRSPAHFGSNFVSVTQQKRLAHVDCWQERTSGTMLRSAKHRMLLSSTFCTTVHLCFYCCSSGLGGRLTLVLAANAHSRGFDLAEAKRLPSSPPLEREVRRFTKA